MKKIDQLIEATTIETEELIKKIKENPQVLAFLKNNKIKEQEIRDNLTTFLAFVDKNEECLNCQGLARCTQNIIGNKPVLAKEDGNIELLYEECDYALIDKNEKAKFVNFKTRAFTPRQITFEDIYRNDGRNELLMHIINFTKRYPKGEKVKGVYVYGPFGSGKTFILNYLALQMALAGYQVLFAYYPDLVRKIKSMITSNDYEFIVEEMKNVDILILDDLGAESNTSFIRDEVLGPVLQARMEMQKPVFITSNLSEQDLRDHLATTKSNIEVIKAGRIIERIRALADIIYLNDQNYRL